MGLRVDSSTRLFYAARLNGNDGVSRVSTPPRIPRGNPTPQSNAASRTAQNARLPLPGAAAFNRASAPLLGRTPPDADTVQGFADTERNGARTPGLEGGERAFQPEVGHFTQDLQQAAARAGYLARQYVNGFGEAAQRIAARLDGTPPPNMQTVSIQAGGQSFTYGYLPQEPPRFRFTA